GGTLDVSLLETKDGRLRVVDHSGDNFLGGKDIDQALLEWALARAGADRSPRALAGLKAACEEAKIALSRRAHDAGGPRAGGGRRGPGSADHAVATGRADGAAADAQPGDRAGAAG